MSNIVKFDEYTGKVFGTLYEAFPIPESINSENLPLGARLATAIKTGATETIIKLSAQTIAVGVKMAFNKIGLNLS
ncbi:hypothetical protein LDH75_004718 [Escherichia coli]|nr:hypothetical protein [Escherichia coli]